MLPIWDWLPVSAGWLQVVVILICYGLPLTLAITLATGLARTLSRGLAPPWRQLLIPTVRKTLLHSSLFLLALLTQGCLALYLIRDLLTPAAIMATLGEPGPSSPFLARDTILGTQLTMAGGLLLVLQLLFAVFVTPLYLFREIPFYPCWRQSFLAMQLNPWLNPVLALSGLVMILLGYFDIFSVFAQLLALPLPPYLGALFYIAWRELFQSNSERESSSARKATA
jgi:hypothetical protein